MATCERRYSARVWATRRLVRCWRVLARTASADWGWGRTCMGSATDICKRTRQKCA